ncbi:MAG: D-aminoacyl-tRNA deacylase [Dehalococcoidales bacterium]|nr:D-aminoacyl-tRNA deacylase [Dehalococcoidales bacterium]
MKALVQRVSRASVRVAGEEAGRIDRGLVVFIGVADGDTEQDAQYVMQKVINLRIFSDAEEKFNLTAADVGGGLLVVSQFTLLADTRRGRRPSFTGAADPESAETLFNYCVELARESGLPVATGRFQQHMDVEIHNDGPVTIMVDSRDKFS